jgi:deoxycitidine kinase/deoxyguanosine kinase
MLYDNGCIEEIEYTIYIRWFDEFKKYTEINKIIYIQTDPELCLERINKRNRKGEENIPLEYLISCHQYHEDWIFNNSTIDLLLIDGKSIDLNKVLSSLK